MKAFLKYDPTSLLCKTLTKASMIGTIIAAVAPLEIHMDTKAVVAMNPKRIMFGDVPKKRMIRNAILWNQFHSKL